MKKVTLIVLLFIAQLLCAQENWAIVDGKTYNKYEYDSLITVLKATALDTTVKTSITKYTGRPNKCLCVEFHFMTLDGPQFTRDCNVYEVHFSSKNGVLDIIRPNNKIDSYWVYDPFTWLPVERMLPKFVDIFEIDWDKYSQGQKPWITYSDGTHYNK